MISTTSDRTRRCRTSFTTSDVALCASPGLVGSSPEKDRYPTQRRAAGLRPRLRPHRKRPAEGTGAGARPGQHAPSLAGSVPQLGFAPRSYSSEANAGLLACQLAAVLWEQA